MIEVRFHGRGGQGAVTSAELMARTAIGDGKYAQAFPSFGPERRGAPVTAFLRISEAPIRLREKVYEPNVVVILDPTVMNVTKVDAGLQKDGILIVNTQKTAADIRKQYGFKQIAQIGRQKFALRIKATPLVLRATPIRVEFREILLAQRVQLAPVRPAAEGSENLLAGIKQLRVIHPDILVDRQGDAVTAIEGAQPDIVALDQANLDRKRCRDPVRSDARDDSPQHLRRHAYRKGILHLAETRGSRGGKCFPAPAWTT